MKTEVETQIISRSPDVMSGAPVFAGTRVPVQTMIDYLAGGHPLDEFLDDFPTVRREQALELLRWVKVLLSGAQICECSSTSAVLKSSNAKLQPTSSAACRRWVGPGR